MLALERHKQILKLLEERKSMTVPELCTEIYASPATVRRDLAALEKEGLLKRSYGGAVINESYTDQIPLVLRSAKNIKEKKKICAKAVNLIKPGYTIFIDNSSTTYFLVPLLKDIPDLTVVTNNPVICTTLAEYNVRCFCTGGELLNGSVALIGSEAERFISSMRADACFISSCGYNDEFCTDVSKRERDLKIKMLENSNKCYYLCDTSKKGKEFPFVIANFKDIDAVIEEK
ncbi:MAG: DeoR/GlpR transcriptional regulator [Ruminococcaceae bacterium]|nr:DeoR/GlpR transcriptional regulator [Oscillospiraceae bacterium]